MPSDWSRARMVAIAAAVVAAAGIIVVVTDDDDDECDTLKARLAAIEARYEGDEPAQTWDDILAVNEDGTERSRILRDLAATGCT